MQLDHVFIFVDQKASAIMDLVSKGLAVSYRRDHVGQGTANACFVFDNAFLELLYLTSETDARLAPIERTKLWERSQWQAMHTCPYGIAWRGDDIGIATWPFMPPYLPQGVEIPVAIDSDDQNLPMMFTFPGSKAPKDWPDEKRRFPAHPGGWNSITQVELALPNWTLQSSAALKHMASCIKPPLIVTRGDKYAMMVTLGGPDGAKLTLSF